MNEWKNEWMDEKIMNEPHFKIKYTRHYSPLDNAR